MIISCCGVDVVSIKESEKELLFLGCKCAEISAARYMVQCTLKRMHPPASELFSKPNGIKHVVNNISASG